MPRPSADRGLRHLPELMALEDRHRSVSFEEAREAVFAEEHAGWRLFVEKYSRFVYTVALRLLSGSGQEKEDLAQEIYCRVFSLIQRNDYRVLRRFQSRCQFTTYLFRMVQTARSGVLHEERGARESTDFVDFSDEANQNIEAAVQRRSQPAHPLPLLSPEKLGREIAAILDGLPPREALLVRFRFQKGLKLREIADSLGYRDTNDAAYALRRTLKRFEPMAALADGEWTEQETAVALDVLERELFQ